jgi:hypothetical protein
MSDQTDPRTGPEMLVARVFDGADENGVGYFRDDHQRLDDDERQRVARYLDAGAGVLLTTGQEADVVDPERGEVVPLSFRTDGRWIWCDALSYYLTTYGFFPEPELHARIVELDYTCPTVDEAGVQRAFDALVAASEEASDADEVSD